MAAVQGPLEAMSAEDFNLLAIFYSGGNTLWASQFIAGSLVLHLIFDVKDCTGVLYWRNEMRQESIRSIDSGN